MGQMLGFYIYILIVNRPYFLLTLRPLVASLLYLLYTQISCIFQSIIIIIIIILCSIDSGDVDARPTPFKESRHRSLWPLQITITLTESALLIFFCNPGLKNCWHGWPGIEPTTKTLDLSSQSGAYDLSATASINQFSSSRLLL